MSSDIRSDGPIDQGPAYEIPEEQTEPTLQERSTEEGSADQPTLSTLPEVGATRDSLHLLAAEFDPQREPSNQLMHLPVELRYEIGAHLSRKDLDSLARTNKEFHKLYSKAALDSLEKGREIRNELRSLQTSGNTTTQSAKLDVVLEQLSSQRWADRPKDIKAIFSSLRAGGGLVLLPEAQAGKLWSHMSKAPIDQEMLDAMNILSKIPVPKDESTAIINGLLDHFEEHTTLGNMPQTTTNHEHYLLVPARMLKYLPPTEKPAVAGRIRDMLGPVDSFPKRVVARSI
jgi:hypothetical protein